MEEDDIEGLVRETIAAQLQVPVAKVLNASTFRDDLNVDSVSMIDLLLAMEQKFGITIEDAALHRMWTVGDVTEYIRARR